MDKKEFIRFCNETKIFNELKDKYFSGMRYLKKRYGNMDADLYRVYRKIINYRIKRYGTSLISDVKTFY